MIKNASNQPRAGHFAGVLFELPAGETVNVPKGDVAKARASDPVIKGWFDDGVLVEIVDTSAMPRVSVKDTEGEKADGKPEKSAKK